MEPPAPSSFVERNATPFVLVDDAVCRRQVLPFECVAADEWDRLAPVLGVVEAQM